MALDAPEGKQLQTASTGDCDEVRLYMEMDANRSEMAGRCAQGTFAVGKVGEAVRVLGPSILGAARLRIGPSSSYFYGHGGRYGTQSTAKNASRPGLYGRISREPVVSNHFHSLNECGRLVRRLKTDGGGNAYLLITSQPLCLR